MSTKISELPSATSLTNADEVPIVQTGTTKKATVGLLQQNANYSTTEQVIGTWIDGKPLYRKIYTGTFPTVTTDGTQQTKTIDITGLSVNSMIIDWAGTYSPDGTAYQPFPLIRRLSGTTAEFVARVLSSNTAITVYSNFSSYNSNTYIISFLYTKTTD